MSARSLRTFWWALIVFVPLVTIFSGTYAYQAVARYGDDVSFTSCPAVIAYPQEGPCVAALQQLLNADSPHAGIYHDGIFGPQTLAATRQFQSGHGLPASGKSRRRDDSGTRPACPGPAPGPGRGGPDDRLPGGHHPAGPADGPAQA